MIKKRIIIFIMIIVLFGIFSIYYPNLKDAAGISGNSVSGEYSRESAILVRVIDGDTIVVSGKEIGNETHIRMLGINSPEKKMPFSNNSANFLRQFEGKRIELLRDWEDVDKYKRKLRYVFADDGKRFLNLEILEQGFANSYYTKSLRYEKEVLRAEEQARTNGLGIWTKSGEKCAVDACIQLKELNAKEEFFILRNDCGFSCELAGWFVKDAGRNTFYLSPLAAGEEKTYNSGEGKDVWNNDGDRFFIFDKSGLMAGYEGYS